MADVLKKKNN